MAMIKCGVWVSSIPTSDWLVLPLAVITKTSPRSKLGLIILAYMAFISLGMPDGLFGVAWPSIREDFGLRLDSVGAFFFAGTTGYVFSSFFSGKIISWLGVGGTLAISCALTASALLGYTLVPSWWMMGPIIMTAGLTLFNAWRVGYRVVGAAQLLLAASFLLTMRMWRDDGLPHAPEQERHLTDYQTPFLETLRQPVVWLNLLLFALYTGAEISFGSWTYSLLTLSRKVPVVVAGLWAGSYWATFTIGRIMAGLLTRRFGMA